jgi:hypothetical protein
LSVCQQKYGTIEFAKKNYLLEYLQSFLSKAIDFFLCNIFLSNEMYYLHVVFELVKPDDFHSTEVSAVK